MEGYHPMKLKRKDLEDVNDDFSDFSLSSPARKIRRLDAELPPIIEEEECEVPIAFEQSLPGGDSLGGIKIEELPSLPYNDERAIVLFKPASLPRSPSDFSVSVDPHFISAFKNQVPWSNQSNPWRLADDERTENNNSYSGNGCLAVVPWVPSHLSPEAAAEITSQIDYPEMMDTQDLEEEKMDVQDCTGGDIIEQRNVNGAGGMSLSGSVHQWQQQQQHCLVPQPPHNTAAPIVWYR